MNRYKNHIFISYAREQRNTIETFVNELQQAGITVWWDKEIGIGEKFQKEIDAAIRNCRHFLLYCTVQAKASTPVSHEITVFRDDAKEDPSRKFFVLKAPTCEDKHVPSKLGVYQRANTLQDIIIHLLKDNLKELDGRFRELQNSEKEGKRILEEELALERAKVSEARKFYQHRRFWNPFAASKDVHIFTCGRDIPPDHSRPRGTAGFRTNIDKWDYRAVLGIAHYFASNYPGTRLTIEDPESKLQQEDILQTPVLASRIAEVENKIKGKDCIIIGSPDVNDFAEIVLSRIHRIFPYDDNRKKSMGYVLIRNKKNTASSFYWETKEGEYEGIGSLGKDEMKIFRHEPPVENAKHSVAGTMHGILVVADNPFSAGEKRKIMILSGFSGVATNAMVKFLTEDAYLKSFFAFDEKHSYQAPAIEAVISVKYTMGSGTENKDTRTINLENDSIRFEELVELR
jgi:hypothetical protein